ncbi:MAG: hypothetical protein HY094_01485 [Candidatus Melainabacteria bacterium]|nr:hypothetical protein [Candidatus Melainabacteria bacterium]
MLKKEKLSYKEILDELNLTEDTLSSLERVMEGKNSSDSENYRNHTNYSNNNEEVAPLEITQKLRESGLNSFEINFLASFSEKLKGILDDVGGINNLVKISPAYKVKQALNVAREELHYLKSHIQKLEKTQEDASKLKNKIFQLQSELGTKNQVINNQEQVIDNKNQIIENQNKQLDDALTLNDQLGEQLNSYKRNKTVVPDYYPGRGKERYYSANERDFELFETRKKNQELLEELQRSEKEFVELKEELEITKGKTTKVVQDVEREYKDKITNLREQIDSAVNKKQKEWDQYYARLCEQHKVELLTLQKRHDEHIVNLKQNIEQREKEFYGSNPVLELFSKVGRKIK